MFTKGMKYPIDLYEKEYQQVILSTLNDVHVHHIF